MLLLVMLFSGVVCGDEIRMPSDSAPGVYGEGRSNLLIGGIDQNGPNPDQNPKYETFADQIGAMYIPTYYALSADGKPDRIANAFQVNSAASSGTTTDVNGGLPTYQPTYQNGLKDDALTGEPDNPIKYDTIVAYSGGTVTALTALDKQNVQCNTLILISPMRATPPEVLKLLMDPTATISPGIETQLYFDQINRILKNGNVQRIVVIQSPNDNPYLGGLYQAKFPTSKDPRIEVVPDINLGTTGDTAHWDIFNAYARDHLRLGSNGRVYYVEQPLSQRQSTAFSNPWSNPKYTQYGIGTPLLAPPSSDMWSGAFSEVPGVPETIGPSGTTGVPQTSPANIHVWWVDWSILIPEGEYEPGHPGILPCPRYLPSGELNTYGYSWIYLPASQRGTYSQRYFNEAVAYLASFGTGSSVAGVGTVF
jgi:hypothetical protein